MKRRSRPLCETPRNGYFCGPDKYLRLQEHTIREELFPIMDVDSDFVLVREGSGSFIINGEEFPVRPGCDARNQCTQVLTICPEVGEALQPQSRHAQHGGAHGGLGRRGGLVRRG